MRNKAEALKVVDDEEYIDESSEEAESTDEQESSVPELRSSEAIGFSHIQSLVRPMRETEISLARLDQHLLLMREFDQEAASQYSRLAVSLIAGVEKRVSLRRLLLVSANHFEGRTSVMLNLATALTRAGRKVLVVDTDFLRPSVGRLLGIECEIGLTEALSERLVAEAAVMRIVPAGFDVLPTRAQVENSAEILTSNRFKAMLTALDPYYDFILFDSAPLLASSDASLLVLQTDATLLVMRSGMTTTSQLAKAVSQLKQESLFGVVLNRVNS